MRLRVNGNVVTTWNDVAASWTTYSYATPLSGKDQIEVVYPNDCNINGSDRNLYIDYVIVDGQTVQAEGAATLIDWGIDDASSDGQNMALGSQNLTGNGALRFVKGAGAYAAGYDANGNMTSRIVNGAAYLYVYDAENRLTGVSGAGAATFVYDADGNRVKGTVAGVTTVYIGSHFEWSNGVAKKYYYAGSLRIAMNQGGTLSWLLGDHLGSTTLTVNTAGARQGELLFKPFGETRFTYGTTPTSYRFTGQREESALGIYYYNARWYDSALARFISADTIVPGVSAQSWDRYAYARNNSLKYTDPTGHIACWDDNWYPSCENPINNPYGFKNPDPTRLTPKGKKIFVLYEKAKAWYGGGLMDFIAVALSREFMGMNLGWVRSTGDPLEILQHAMTHRAYMNCAANNGNQPCSSLSQGAIFNFIGGFSQSVWVIYKHVVEEKGKFNSDIVPPITPAAWGVARSLVNPVEAEWKLATGYLGDHPADYGNASLFNVKEMPGGSIEQFLSEQGMPVIWVYGDPDNPLEDLAYVFTVDQAQALSPFKK